MSELTAASANGEATTYTALNREKSPILRFATQRTESAFNEIPVMSDLQGATNTDLETRRALADLVRDACVNVGFFYVTNHGIPDNFAPEAIEYAKKFFALDLNEKMKFDIHQTTNFKGYTALLGENTDPENRGDMHEGFDIGWEEPEESSTRSKDGAMTGGNVWPEVDGFREAALAYYHAAVRLGQYLFPLFALALDLPENFFEDKTTNPAAIMRLLYYPPQTGTVDDRVLGIGAHTDYECFTILWQQNGIQALQVLNADGVWVDAVPIPGTLVVNIGDQLARWTNDVFKSTKHRAVNRSGIERHSIPLFFGTDYNVLLEALPSCVSDDMPSKYEPVLAGDYVKQRLEETYAHSK